MQEELKMDFEDLRIILSYEGKIDGIVGSCKIDEFTNGFSENFKASLQNAKGVLVEFEQHRDLPIKTIIELMTDLQNLVHIDAEFLLATKHNDIFDKDMIGFKIIVTGLASNS
ncbi:MAG: hypothetical protein QG565_1094 [Campylobacterota bacterium]|nr:hypothetical protein [Campylobacterota bacterium]MDQ1267451.1 hypothetical protein [Campylobacterota bacterium]MDQ1338181.1 hypothetical protein [Campylobacterota bacterium]